MTTQSMLRIAEKIQARAMERAIIDEVDRLTHEAATSINQAACLAGAERYADQLLTIQEAVNELLVQLVCDLDANNRHAQAAWDQR